MVDVYCLVREGILFVPIVPPPPSEKVRELSSRLAEVIRAYRHEHPGMKDLEVQQALRLAATETGTGAMLQITIGAILALMLLGFLVFFFMARF